VDLNGILYIADAGAHLVYAVDKSGIVHQLAGNGTTTTTVPGQASGTALITPSSLSVDAAGDLYIADASANRVYTVYSSTTSSGSNIASIFGTGTAGNAGDGSSSNLAQVNNPLSVAVDGSSNLFVVDNGNSSVREITYPQSNPRIRHRNRLASALPSCGRTSATSAPITSASPLPSSHPTRSSSFDGNTTTCGYHDHRRLYLHHRLHLHPNREWPYHRLCFARYELIQQPTAHPTRGHRQGSSHRFSSHFHLRLRLYGQPFPETVLGQQC